MIVFPTGKSADDYKDGEIPDYKGSHYYHTDKTRREVAAFLARAKECIKEDKFVVLEEGGTRRKNSDFLNLYGLYARSEQKRVLLAVDVEEFCHSIISSDGDELYVFCARRRLYKTATGPCDVAIYIKHSCPEKAQPFDVVVSMHELESPIDLVFID